MQSELPLIGEINNEIKELPWDLVAKCKTVQGAYRLCINQQRVYRTQEDISELLGMKKRSALNAILNSDQSAQERHLGRVREIKLQKICNNKAIDQWASLFERGLLDCQKSLEQKRADLLAALTVLDNQLEDR